MILSLKKNSVSNTILVNQECGYTILEVIVAVSILAVVISYSSISLVTHVGANHQSVIHSEAAQAAQTVIDDLRTVAIPSMKTTGADAPVDIQVSISRTYSVTVNYCVDTSYCTSPESRHISVDVEYQNEIIYSTETVFTGISQTASGVSSFNSGGGCWKC